MTRNHSAIPFERYADDAICHCKSEAEASALRVLLEERLTECGLTLHPEFDFGHLASLTRRCKARE
jgi:retron-type reverse transcriptase